MKAVKRGDARYETLSAILGAGPANMRPTFAWTFSAIQFNEQDTFGLQNTIWHIC